MKWSRMDLVHDWTADLGRERNERRRKLWLTVRHRRRRRAARLLQVRVVHRRLRARASSRVITRQGFPDLRSFVNGIVLPIGISFYTFEGDLATWSTSTGATLATERSLLRYAFFISFFPHRVDGPDRAIRRPRDRSCIVRHHFDAGPRSHRGVLLFTIGLSKEDADRRRDRAATWTTTWQIARRARSREGMVVRSRLRASRSTSTSPATRTWRSGSRGSSASSCRRTSTAPTASASLDGVLEALAHDALDVAPRLPVHPARR